MTTIRPIRRHNPNHAGDPALLRFVFFLAWIVLVATAIAVGESGCALPGMTQGQTTSALVQAGGQGYGADYLTQQEVNGVVPPTVLAQYEANLNGIYGVMQGHMDAHTFANIVQQIKGSSAVTSTQAGAVGVLSSVSATYIKANGGTTPTADGAVTDALAKQLATGLAAAIDQVTGTPYAIPPEAPSTF